MPKFKIDSGLSQTEEMREIGLDPYDENDRLFFKMLYTIWAEEKAAVLASLQNQASNIIDEFSLNELIAKRVDRRLLELRHNATIN